MRTAGFIRALALIIASLIALLGWTQVSTPSNTPGGPGNFVGWNSTAGVPLEVRHNGNQRIQWYTDSLQRMQLWNTRYGTINGFTNVGQNGYLGISNQPLFFQDFFNSAGPFSRLHLADSCNNNQNDYAQVFGWRPWMKNGVSMTGNKDQCYLGQKYDGVTTANDSSDIVLQWSDNPADSPWPSDRLRFLFTNTYQSTKAYGAHSKEGLESFRIFVPNDTDAFVGIGDFYRARYFNGGVMVDPTERLDVLDGRVRIRALANNNAATRMVVADNNGVLWWQNIPGGGGSNCDWDINTGANRLTTAWQGLGSNGSCPEVDWTVGIGTASPGAKLHAYHAAAGAGAERTVKIDMLGALDDNYGMELYTRPATAGTIMDEAWGIYNLVQNARITIGTISRADITPGITVSGSASGVIGSTSNYGTTTLDQFGVSGTAHVQVGGSTRNIHGLYGWGNNYNAAGSAMVRNIYGVYGLAQGDYINGRYGVWGAASPSGAPNTSWAGYFQGNVQVTGQMWNNATLIFSDASLKTNVQAITGASTLLSQLQPRTYDFIPQDPAQLNPSSGTQLGLIAQELEQVLPELVGVTYVPAVVDSLGNELEAGKTLKGVNYTGLVPLLIAGWQEQQDRIGALEQQLASCCALDSDQRMQQGTGIGYIDNALEPAAQAADALAKDDLVVIPNPFQENPTISYRIGTTGRAQLRVSSSEGRDMGLLFDAGMQAGQHTLVWNTTGMAAGTYWLTLTLDGVRITEQAVKVQ